MADIDTGYYLERAEQEQVRAIQADHPKAAAAHRRLSERYSVTAIIAIANEQDDPKQRARHRGMIANMRIATQIGRG